MYTAPENEEAILRPTIATIDLDAFRQNLRKVASRVPEASRVIAVLKADAYGHGAIPLARVCESEPVSMLAVALLEEAIELRREGIELPLLVLGAITSEREVEIAATHSLELSIPSPESLLAVSRWCQASRRETTIHLHLDSGMNRVGLIESDLPAALRVIRESPFLRIAGISSHYANASDPDDALNRQQEERFDRMIRVCGEAGIRPPVHHFANSAAIVSGRMRAGDWVRAGLILYGGEPLDRGESRLLPVMQWSTRIVRLKEIGPGEVVGYGGTWRAERRSRIATLPVGYADGYDRLLSNRGDVLVRGRRAPIAGRVSMDLTTIDVTDLPEVKVGDEVVLIGVQGEEAIRAEELAERIGTIPYEIFTSVSKRVPRVYVE